jgi:hypothetical protein
MKSRYWMSITSLIVLSLAIPMQLAAQERTPAPNANQSISANSAPDYLEADLSIGFRYGQRGYCTTNSSGLTGYCVAYSYMNFCSVKRSTGCPYRLKAIKPGYYQCALMQKIFVDLGRSCSY